MRALRTLALLAAPAAAASLTRLSHRGSGELSLEPASLRTLSELVEASLTREDLLERQCADAEASWDLAQDDAENAARFATQSAAAQATRVTRGTAASQTADLGVDAVRAAENARRVHCASMASAYASQLRVLRDSEAASHVIVEAADACRSGAGAGVLLIGCSTGEATDDSDGDSDSDGDEDDASLGDLDLRPLAADPAPVGLALLVRPDDSALVTARVRCAPAGSSPPNCGDLSDGAHHIRGSLEDLAAQTRQAQQRAAAQCRTAANATITDAALAKRKVSAASNAGATQNYLLRAKMEAAAGKRRELSSTKALRQSRKQVCVESLADLQFARGRLVEERRALRDALVRSGRLKASELVEDCSVSKWVGDVGCSRKCGGGRRSLRREIIAKGTTWGAQCPLLKLSVSCNRQPCLAPCEVSKWQPWTECSAKCGGGTQTRSRRKTEAVVKGALAQADVLPKKAAETSPSQSTKAETMTTTFKKKSSMALLRRVGLSSTILQGGNVVVDDAETASPAPQDILTVEAVCPPLEELRLCNSQKCLGQDPDKACKFVAEDPPAGSVVSSTPRCSQRCGGGHWRRLLRLTATSPAEMCAAEKTDYVRCNRAPCSVPGPGQATGLEHRIEAEAFLVAEAGLLRAGDWCRGGQVALLVDASSSMTADQTRLLLSSAGRAAALLTAQGAEVSVLRFGQEAAEVASPKDLRAMMKTAFGGQLPTGAPTPKSSDPPATSLAALLAAASPGPIVRSHAFQAALGDAVGPPDRVGGSYVHEGLVVAGALLEEAAGSGGARPQSVLVMTFQRPATVESTRVVMRDSAARGLRTVFLDLAKTNVRALRAVAEFKEDVVTDLPSALNGVCA